MTQETIIYDNFLKENSNASKLVMNEATQTTVVNKVLDKLFELTIGKYNKIDFSEIERSKGDITKIRFYKNLRECIDTLKEIDTVTHDLKDIYIIDTAMLNMVRLKSLFMDSFKIKNNFGIMVYNTVCYAIMETTSYLISAAINFVDDNGSVKVETNTTNYDRNLVTSLEKFNKCASDGNIYKFIKEGEKAVLNESTAIDILSGFLGSKIGKKVTIGIAVLVAAVAVISFSKIMIYTFFRFKHTISESARIQAEMLELNIERLKTMDGTEKIVVKQQKWVDRFNKIAKTFAISYDKSSRDAKIDMNNDKVDVSSVII